MCGYFCIGFIDFMLAGKKLTDYTNMFSPYDFKNKTKFRLSEIIAIENYFHQEINQRNNTVKN